MRLCKGKEMMILELKDREKTLRIDTGFSSGMRTELQGEPLIVQST